MEREEQIKFLTDLVISEKESITSAAKKLCVKMGVEYTDSKRRKFSKMLESKKITKNKRVIEESEQFKKAKEKKLDKRRKTFIITWGQNGTPVHKNFFDNIEAYAAHKKAGVHVY